MHTSGSRSVLESRAGMLLDWTDVDKALLLVGVPVPLLLGSIVRIRVLLADPTDEPYLSRRTLVHIEWAILAYTVAALTLVAIGRRLRKGSSEARPFVQACLFLFFFTCAAGAYFVGHFSTPILGGCVAGTIAVALLFDARSVQRMLWLGAAMLFAPIVPIALHLVPYAPLYDASPFIGSDPPPTWLLTTSLYSLVFVVGPLVILKEVMQRWREKDEELHRLARLDGLTEIPNRRYFLDRLDVEIARSARNGKGLALLLLDLDHFKRINDKHGHQNGDEALVHVADALSNQLVRKIDVVGRYGGEEFAVLLPETDMEGAMVVAERIRAGIAERAVELDDGTKVTLTTSIGVAAYPSAGVKDLDSLVRWADEALYRAKERGRNCVDNQGDRRDSSTNAPRPSKS